MKSKSSIRRAMRAHPELFKLPDSDLQPSHMAWPLVTLTTDGGCEPNPGLGSWAAVLRMGLHHRELSGLCRDTPTTNNRAELEAILNGFLALTRSCRVTVRTDSRLCIQILRMPKNGKGTKKNLDMIQDCRLAMRAHFVTWEWVKGHAGDPDNERCDSLCSKLLASPSVSAILP